MTLHGEKDSDDAQKSSLEKRQPGEVVKKAGRPKRDATELFNKHIESGRMEQLVDKVFDSWERGLDSNNDTLAVSTAEKFTKAFYNPDKKLVIEGGPTAEQIHMNIMLQQDSLSEKDKAILKKFTLFLEAKSEENIIEVEEILEDPGA